MYVGLMERNTDPDARDITELLEGIDGAFDRAQRGLDQARAGRTVPLDAL